MGHAAYTFWVFAVPLLLAALVEAPIAVVSDRLHRSRLVGHALAVLSASLALCALADRPWILSLGLALAGAATGAACAGAQGELVAAYPGRSERAMARWVTFAAAGDVLAPIVVGAVLWCGGTYRSALFLVAIVAGVQAVGVLCRTAHASIDSRSGMNDPEPQASIRQALGSPRLWGVLLAATMCTLLDEIAVALVALRMTRDLGASEALTAASLTAFSLGSLAGAVAIDGIVARTSVRAVLGVSALASAASLGLVIVARSPQQAAAALFVLGASAAPHYPLLKAAAYDAVPGRPGLVNAAAQAFVGLEVILPLAVGLVAARYGLGAALACLAVESLFVIWGSMIACRRRAIAGDSG